MSDFPRITREDVLDAYELPGGAIIADIGGADGSLLVELLSRHSGRRGVVYDLPSVVAAAVRQTVHAAGLDDRWPSSRGTFLIESNLPASTFCPPSCRTGMTSVLCAS